MFRKTSNTHVQPERRYKKVASSQVEIPFYRRIGQQRGRGFSASAQVFGRTAVIFCVNIWSQLQSAFADFSKFAAPEFLEVFIGRKNFKTAGKNVGRQILRK